MTRPLWILLVTVAYLAFLVVLKRYRLHRARRGGLPPERLAAFDHRAVLDELRELYEAGLPAGAAAPGGGAAPPSGPERPVTWMRADVWEGEGHPALPEAVQEGLRRVQAGRDAEVDALIDPSQPARTDQLYTGLGLHWFLVRYERGDLEGAGRVLERLPTWTNGRISSRVVDKHLAQLDLLKAERGGPAGQRAGADAARRLRRAGATAAFAEPGLRALWAHVTLRHRLRTHNLEWQLPRVDRLLRKALADHRTSAVLFYELAHVSAYRGRSEDAVDHLARALYYAAGEPFYRRPVLEAPEVARLRPGLVEQVRERYRA